MKNGTAPVTAPMQRPWGTRLVQGVVTLALWLVGQVARHRRSRTGYANPRVAHLVGALGYHVHSYRVGLGNLARWSQGQRELFPSVIQVQTINRCNAQCGMCPYPTTVHLEPREVMNAALYTKIAAECAAAPELQDFIPMSQNEALLDKQLVARIHEFKQQAQPHQMVELVTNGSLLTPTKLDELTAAGLDLLTVSVNADSAVSYGKVMAGLSWARLQELLRHLAQRDLPQINVYLRFVKQRDNASEYASFVRRWRRCFNLMSYDINNRAGAVGDYAQLSTAKHALTRQLRRWLGPRLFHGCPHVFSLMTVKQNGDVLLCGNDWLHQETVGNARQQSLRAIYNSPRMVEVRELMRQGRYDEIPACRGCSFRHEWL